MIYNLAIVGCPIDFPFFAESMNLVEVVNLDLAFGQVSTWIRALKKKNIGRKCLGLNHCNNSYMEVSLVLQLRPPRLPAESLQPGVHQP